MQLSLYSKYRNSAGERVRIGLALKGIDYVYCPVGSTADIGLDEYTKINPQKLMPALKVGEIIIPQATAILEFLEEEYPNPRLLPQDAILRAQIRAFAQHIVSEMHAIDVVRVRKFLKNNLQVNQIGIEAWQNNWTSLGFNALEIQLANNKIKWIYCFTNSPGWAEIHLIPQVRKAVDQLKLNLDPYPNIQRIYNECITLPAFIAASPKNQIDSP